jgi:trehalose 6-phosphate phosphatase
VKHILARAARPVLASLARSRSVLMFDYDGTLAPIVPDPERAVMPASTRALVARVLGCYPCAVISGRARADVARRLRGLPIPYLVGNHGLEWSGSRGSRQRFARLVTGWRRTLERELAPWKGVTIEDKTLSLSVHFRHAARKRRAAAAVRAAVARLPRVRVIGGKEVVNAVPEGALHKGDALRRVRALTASERAMYVGDDATDEDAFALARTDGVVAIRVGIKRRSRASYYLKTQREIDALLGILLELRERRTHAER